MKTSLRKEVIEELVRQEGRIVSLSHLCCALLEERVPVRRVMEHLVRLGPVQVVSRYMRPPASRGRPTQEIVYQAKCGIERLLEPERKEACGWDRVWSVIRALSKSHATFSRQDLATLAQVEFENARQFTKLLRRAGHIRERSRGQWVLVKDPGPVRPVGGRK